MFAPTSAQTTLGAQRMAGLVIGTKVLTMDGEMPVEFLSAGDRIITRNGSRKLLATTVTVAHNLAVVRITEGVLAKDTPDTDVLVTSDQAILIRDWRAKAISGKPSAMIPAARLIDGEYIRHETLTEARLFTLHFATEEVVYAGSLELACPATVTA